MHGSVPLPCAFQAVSASVIHISSLTAFWWFLGIKSLCIATKETENKMSHVKTEFYCWKSAKHRVSPHNAYCHLLQISPDESHDMDQRTDWWVWVGTVKSLPCIFSPQKPSHKSSNAAVTPALPFHTTLPSSVSKFLPCSYSFPSSFPTSL